MMNNSANQALNKNISQKEPDNNQSFRLLEKLKYFNLHFFRWKLLTLIIIVGTIAVIYFALMLLSTKQQNTAKVQNTQENYSPTPKSEIDPKLTELTQKKDDFIKRLENFSSYSDKLKAPSVDLNIEF